jgi:2-oxo-4-hydroxy-4-carboxy-5-ureidoimidazoline decarboxylase
VTAEPHDFLNGLGPELAAVALESCCGARAWVEQMLALRPYSSSDALYAAAERVWLGLTVEQQLEAFAHHPRIGDRVGGLSGQEQAGVASAGSQLLAALHAGNLAYEVRFGFVFLVCATGKSADEMLALLTERLTHDRDTELRVAAAEHAKITRLRLAGLVS